MSAATVPSLGFGDDFDDALEDTREFAGSGSKAWQERVPTLGDDVRYGKSGSFDIKTQIDVKGKLKAVVRPTKTIVGILLDSNFSKQDWGPEGSNKLECATSAYTLATKNGPEVKKGGWWKLPYYGEQAIMRYEPVGTKPDPDSGKPMKCADCVAARLNGTCGDKGLLYFLVTGYMQDGEIEAVSDPYVITLQTPKTSGIGFQKYVRETLPERGYRVSQVITRISLTEEVFNGYKTNLANFSPEGEATPEQIGLAAKFYTDGVSAWTKQQEAEKAKYKAEKGKGGKKAAGKTDDSPFTLPDDEIAY